MKKTIIALLALGSVAMAEETVTLFDFNADKLSAFAAGYGVEAVPSYMDMDATTGISVTLAASGDYKLGSGAWTDTPTITGNSFTDLNGSETNLNTWIGADITSTAGTYITGGAKAANADLSITLGNLEAGAKYNVVLLTGLAFEGAGAWNGIYTTNDYTSSSRDFGDQKVDALNVTGFAITEMVANADGAISFTIDGKAAHTAAINGIAIAAAAPIPEPTTATLSLLALAGLAARRRRK